MSTSQLPPKQVLTNICAGMDARLLMRAGLLALLLCGAASAFAPIQIDVLHARSSFSRRWACSLSDTQETDKGRRFAKWFADRRTEVPRPVELNVEGKALPKYVRGDLIRNGPAVWQGADRAYEHAFDGLAKLLKFSISDGQITFATQFIKSNWYKTIVADELSVPASVTVGRVDPPFSVLQNVWGLLTASALDNAPVNVHQIGGEGGPWAAITDPPIAMCFDPKTLETKARLDTCYPNRIVSSTGVELFSTAHPKRCLAQAFRAVAR